MTVGLSTTVIFGDLGATSLQTLEIRPAILHGDMLPVVATCWPEIDCKMNDLE